MISGRNERLDLTSVELTNEVYNEKLSVQFRSMRQIISGIGTIFLAA